MRDLLLVSLALLCQQPSPAAQDPARAEILRDSWGVPNIFARTDADAMFALGYVQAKDRGFQMQYRLRLVQGRLAETVGNVRHTRRRDTAVLHDEKMRTFGWWRAAQKAAERLPNETRELLGAYCDGVNAAITEYAKDAHPACEATGLRMEPWTPAACVATWWYLAQFFATDGTRDAIARRGSGGRRRQQLEEARRASGLEALPPDDSAAVVRESDMSEGLRSRIRQFLDQHSGAAKKPADGEGRKFSHAWVVGGRRSASKGALLVSDPQTNVTFPALFHEYHVQGDRIHARGIGVPGCPVLLIGFTPGVAWGLTALGADQADLFELETRPENRDSYRWNDGWRPFEVREERILVRGGKARTVRIRESHLGPDITKFAYAARGEGPFVSRRVPLATCRASTLVAGFGIMRARDADAFVAAMADWRFPSANVVFGDARGSIGYWAQAAIPLRSGTQPSGGRFAMRATSDADDWRTFVPHLLLPHVRDPERGVLFSGNHRPVASFYPISLGSMTGSGGDGVRSWRLRELLSGEEPLAFEDMLRMQSDTVCPARRELVRLALHLRERQGAKFGAEANQALEILAPWFRSGAKSDLRVPGAALATEIPPQFRFVQTELTFRFGGGLGGLTRFLKDSKQRLDADANARFGDREIAYLDRILADALRSARQRYGEFFATPATRLMAGGPLPYLRSLDGFPSPVPAWRLPPSNLYCRDGLTVLSQAAQSYTQAVDLGAVDAARSLLPPQHSDRMEDPESEAGQMAARTSALWARGELHPAPLSRRAVERITVSRIRLP